MIFSCKIVKENTQASSTLLLTTTTAHFVVGSWNWRDALVEDFCQLHPEIPAPKYICNYAKSDLHFKSRKKSNMSHQATADSNETLLVTFACKLKSTEKNLA